MIAPDRYLACAWPVARAQRNCESCSLVCPNPRTCRSCGRPVAPERLIPGNSGPLPLAPRLGAHCPARVPVCARAK
jgi:hypothetical protein